jgi:hypothetical protein
LAEMLIVGGVGATLALEPLLGANGGRLDRVCFGEAASRVIVAVAKGNVEEVLKRASDSDLDVLRLGMVDGGGAMSLDIAGTVEVAKLRDTWESGLKLGR